MPKRVHVIEGDVKHRAKLARTMSDMGISNEIYDSIEEFLERAPTEGLIFVNDDQSPSACTNIVTALQDRETLLPVVMYSDTPKPEQIVQAMLAGAIDYLAYPVDPAAINGAFDKLQSDHIRMARDQKSRDALKRVQQLSGRELEVLRCVVQGQSSKDIGDALGISARTVEVHRSRIMSKLNARSTAEIVRLAIYAGVDK